MEELQRVFKNFASDGPLQRAESLTGIFKQLEASQFGLVRATYQTAIQALELPMDHPLAQAGMDIARLIDSPPGTINYGGHGNAYHNRNHMFEVLTGTTALISLHVEKNCSPPLDVEDKLLLLTAAVAHDLDHNGKGNGMGANRKPLLTEQHSIDLAKPIIRARYSESETDRFEKDFARFETLIAATDIGGGKTVAAFFEDFARYQAQHVKEPPQAPAPELEKFANALKRFPALPEMCLIMQDADIIPSIGLTCEWAQKQDARMASENPSTQRPDGTVNTAGTIWFYENLAKLGSQAGKEFQCNFDEIKKAANAREEAFLKNPPQRKLIV